MTSTTQTQSSPLLNKLRPDHYSKFEKITYEENKGAGFGSSIALLADTSISVTALGTTNIEMIDNSILKCESLFSIMYLQTTSLIGSITGLTATDNTNTVNGVISITGGGTLTFTTATLSKNYGTSTSDLFIENCPSCIVSFTGSTFTRDVVTTTGTGIVYNRIRPITAKIGGTLRFENSNFSNYLLVTQGGVMSLTQVIVPITNCTFNNNSAGTGGVFYAEDTVTLTLKNATFTNNKANLLAGVIYARISKLLII